jgi:hypothetical protein
MFSLLSGPPYFSTLSHKRHNFQEKKISLFKKECRNKQLQPKYIQIKIKGNNNQKPKYKDSGNKI